MINQTYPASGSRRGQECSITPSVPLDSNDNTSKSAADRGMKSTVLGIIVNLGLAVIKCSAGLLGNSFALVADGLESVTDVFSGLAGRMTYVSDVPLLVFNEEEFNIGQLGVKEEEILG